MPSVEIPDPMKLDRLEPGELSMKVPILVRDEYPRGVVPISYYKRPSFMGRLGVEIIGEPGLPPDSINVQRQDNPEAELQIEMRMEYWRTQVLEHSVERVIFVRSERGIWLAEADAPITDPFGFGTFATLVTSNALRKQRDLRISETEAQRQTGPQ